MNENVRVVLGDCRDTLCELPAGLVDSIVTDPPYELGFMGKRWDSSGVAYDVAVWLECLRVLKPGGHLLAFGGTRTYHRLAVAIEDAGFEIRDSIHWLYGSGFPKSLDVSKAIDKLAGHWRGKAGPIVSSNGAMSGPNYERTDKGDPITPAAAGAAGWGTALKPAHEPIVVARKPLVGTVATNVLQHGTGALNIDGTRVGVDEVTINRFDNGAKPFGGAVGEPYTAHIVTGRWPANLVFTHAADCGETCATDCPVAALDEQSGTTTSTARIGAPGGTTFGGGEMKAEVGKWFGDSGGASRFFTVTKWDPIADTVPFRYVAKPSRRERNAGLDGLPERSGGEMTDRKDGSAGLSSPRAGAGRTGGGSNIHPTVKPVALMRWLVRLVTPPGGTVLDPFTGSGTTAIAAIFEGFRFHGCELTADYLPIIERRIAWAQSQPPEPEPQPNLFT